MVFYSFTQATCKAAENMKKYILLKDCISQPVLLLLRKQATPPENHYFLISSLKLTLIVVFSENATLFTGLTQCNAMAIRKI